jgi:alpha-mannosidase
VPVAEPLTLRNEFFEVGLSEATGGITHIKPYTRSPNRLSHQIAFRFPRTRKLKNPEAPDAPPVESYYSEMRMTGTQVLCAGPGLGEIETIGDIVNQENGEVLASYRQVVRVWRGKPIVEIEIDLDIQKLPEGDPWSNYYAVRFAWKHESAVVSRSDQHAPRIVNHERIESPEFIEIADNNDRTTIVPMGLPFHRKTGNRMLDTLLVVAGETRRKFRFQVMVDVPFPLQAALDGMSPSLVVPTESGPPRSGDTGWFFHLDTPHVQLMRILPPRLDPKSSSPAAKGCILRLMETEGRRAVCKLSMFLTPRTVRQVDLLGKTIAHPKIEGDEVRIEIAPFEVCDVELTFG